MQCEFVDWFIAKFQNLPLYMRHHRAGGNSNGIVMTERLTVWDRDIRIS